MAQATTLADQTSGPAKIIQGTVKTEDGNLYRASQQWRNRPDDERYLDLDTLLDATTAKREASREALQRISNLTVDYANDGASGSLYLDYGQKPQSDQHFAPMGLSNYAFGQLCSMIGVPATYARQLPGPLAAMNVSWGIENTLKESKVLLVPPADLDYDFDPEWGREDEGAVDQSEEHWGTVRAFTSPTYGRIWDSEVVQAVRELNQRDLRPDGEPRWQIPSASYDNADPKRATTLYASDHDVFVFLVDNDRTVEIDGESLFRGFMAWNSEVGDRTFGLQTFLYRRVCDNRIIWGATEITKLIIRHTANGPTRFAEQAMPHLKAYAEGSTTKLERQIHDAKHKILGKDVASVTKWLADKKFGREQIKVSLDLAAREEGDPTSLWNVVQGLTAYARGITHSDTRVDFERKAGSLMAAID